MNVFHLIGREKKLQKRKLFFYGCLSGFANAAVLAVINVAAEHVSNEQETLYYLALFALVAAIYGISQKILMVHATAHVEEAINSLRTRLVKDVASSELATIESIGKEKIYAVISKELQTLSQASSLLVISGQAAILVVFTMVYIAWLSKAAFFIAVFFTLAGAGLHLLRSKQVKENLKRAYDSENILVEYLSGLLSGFKEVKLNKKRTEQLEAEILKQSDDVTEAKVATQNIYSVDFVFSQLTFFILTGAMVFIVPMMSQVYPDVVMKVTTASLFLIGPISNIVGGIPIFSNANAAIRNVLELEERLKSSQSTPDKTLDNIGQRFSKIEIKDLYFRHGNGVGEDKAFSVGPVNMTINAGETIFITGGNGSGKTTFLRMLTALYRADSGTILVDGIKVTDANLVAYRNLFSTVFADFHLFEQLYGIDEALLEDGSAEEWLSYLDMHHKVAIKDNQFNTIKLSTGQRKRLALVVSALENRAICVFDEWAADQDPAHREKFYHDILPKLKRNNQTVIAVTHDDRYFECADHRLKMTDGRIELAVTDNGSEEQ